MIDIKKIFTIFLISTIVIVAQSVDNPISSADSTFIVDSIEITGNEKTKEFVILRELNFSVGDTVNNDVLLYNRERIFSLGLFTKIEIDLKQDAGINTVLILVEESWYIFPVPFINIREKTLERTSYGISLKYKNFRGRNETIRATVSFGWDPFYSLEYENPLLITSADISFYFAGAHGTPINKSPTLDDVNGEVFDFKTFSLNTTWGKRFNKENNIYFILEYSNIQAPSESINPYMASGTSTDESISTGFAYIYDSRNLSQFASSGIYFGIDYIYNGLGTKDISHNAMTVNLNKYNTIFKSLLIKGRINARHTFGEFVPNYNYSMLGYDYYTRGNRYLIREGNNRLLGSVELSYPILPEWNFAVDLPILPESLTRTRIGIHLNVFADAGTVFNNNEKILLEDFNSGYGVGLTLLFLPYSSFRFEYAFNEMGKGEFLLESGISF